MNFGSIALTTVHVLISLAGIVSGFVVLFGWLESKSNERWTRLFLITTIATSVTGFLFPFTRFLPSHAFGIISLAILPVAVLARYKYGLRGPFRWLFTVTSVTAQYLNMFVLIVQLFLKVPPLQALAPTQSEPPFALAQLVNLAFFVWLGIAVTRRSKTWPASAAKATA